MNRSALYPPGIFAPGKPSPRLLRVRSYRDQILQDRPVSYWRLSKVDGTGTRDENGVNTGAYQGGYTLGQPGPLEDEFSASTLFDGSTGYSALSTFTDIPVGANARSIEAWFNYSGNGGTIFSYGDGAAGGQDFSVQVFNSGGTWYLFTDGVNAGNNQTIAAADVPAADTWHHLIFTLVNSTTYQAFLNGRLWKSGTFGTAINTAAITVARIGNRGDAASQLFNGRLTEMAIYADTLLERRSYQHYRRGLGYFI